MNFEMNVRKRMAMCAVALITVAAQAQADALDEARARIDALTESEITTVVTRWINEVGSNCRVQLVATTQRDVQAFINPILFDIANVESGDQDELKRYLDNHVDDVMKEAEEQGTYSFETSGSTTHLVAHDCE
ncbi:hypothetical protein DS901_04205 [Loktanella sp. D2R18]|uniref:hypothetical protein n=1 Tax=Rhodobacterales TaxID=204455 RepID=UPI000DE84C07|nr:MULTISPECIES: hypothetical protein [Rhodobacterales]MDO6589139.1 hypothetical protein [Yoonia sp. 1_MG-2023]RBW45429.1 hypothetical protein DS901_04205 [Loktanella sp. D2R18]